jgi:hypothetical protein
MIDLNTLIAKYGDSTPNMQALVAGFMQYQAHKSNPEYKEYLELQSAVTSMNHQLDSLTSFIRESEQGIYEENNSEDPDGKRKSALLKAVKAYEERQTDIQGILSTVQPRFRELYNKFNQ